MKKILFILLFAGCAVTAAAQVQFETKPTDEVRKMAVEQKKLVFIDLYATWCPPCRMMDRDVFSRKDVGEFMSEHFVSAKYDVDKAIGADMIKRYNAQGVPTYLVFDTEGKLLGRITGASPSDEFIGDLKHIIGGVK